MRSKSNLLFQNKYLEAKYIAIDGVVFEIRQWVDGDFQNVELNPLCANRAPAYMNCYQGHLLFNYRLFIINWVSEASRKGIGTTMLHSAIRRLYA